MSFIEKDTICYLHVYVPERFGEDEMRKHILAFKDGDQYWINYFAEEVIDAFKPFSEDTIDVNESIICPMPSSEKGQWSLGLTMLCKMISECCPVSYSQRLLERIETKQKSHQGGTRDISLIKATMRVNVEELYNKKTVIIFDDITTSGHSYEAAKQLLAEQGIKNAYLIALAWTTDENTYRRYNSSCKIEEVLRKEQDAKDKVKEAVKKLKGGLNYTSGNGEVKESIRAYFGDDEAETLFLTVCDAFLKRMNFAFLKLDETVEQSRLFISGRDNTNYCYIEKGVVWKIHFTDGKTFSFLQKNEKDILSRINVVTLIEPLKSKNVPTRSKHITGSEVRITQGDCIALRLAMMSPHNNDKPKKSEGLQRRCECQKIFTITYEEMEKIKTRGWELPRRCPECRGKRRAVSKKFER